MKNNIKALKLVEKGLKPNTVYKLTEAQINVLYKKMFTEQVKKSEVTTYEIGQQGGELPPSNVPYQVSKNKRGDIKAMPKEQGEVGESKTRNKKKNPYAICTAQLGKEFGTTKRSEWTPAQMKKYEKCKKQVDESLNENKNPISLFLENQVMKIVEKHIPPKITKADFIKYITEDGPAVAPSKPKKEPKTSPTKNPDKTPKKNPKPPNPFRNPNPGEKEVPKAISPEQAKDEVIDVIINLLQ